MTVKEILDPMINGADVQIIRDYSVLNKGSAFTLFNTLPAKILNAKVKLILTDSEGTIKSEIDTPIVTNYEKLKEVFHNISRYSKGSGNLDEIIGLDMCTLFRRDWLDAEYEGNDNE